MTLGVLCLQTLEKGYGYVSLSVKGLELQETSCHALEATRLDDACQVAFESPARTTCCRYTSSLDCFSVLSVLQVYGHWSVINKC